MLSGPVVWLSRTCVCGICIYISMTSCFVTIYRSEDHKNTFIFRCASQAVFLKSNIRKIIVKILKKFPVVTIWTQIIIKTKTRKNSRQNFLVTRWMQNALNWIGEIGKCYFYEHLSTVMVGLASWVHYVNTRFSKSCAWFLFAVIIQTNQADCWNMFLYFFGEIPRNTLRI